MNITYKKFQNKMNVLFICCFVIFLSACGGGGGGEESSGGPQGDIHFNLVLSENETDGGFVKMDNEPFDCAENQISTIEVEVLNGADEEIAFGGPWDCEARRGVISNIEAGSNLRIDVFALDKTGTEIFKGSKEGLTVTAGQTTDAGIVTLFRVGNRKPVFDPVEEQSVNENETLEFFVTASDPDVGQTLTYSAENLPQGAELDAGSGLFSWLPGFEDGGTYSVIFNVNDNGDPVMGDTAEVIIIVKETNRPPQFDPVGDQAIQEAQFFELKVSAADPDENDLLTYSAANLPSGAQFDAETQTLSWTPGFSDAGEYLPEFTVSDNGEPVLTDVMTVKVIVGGTNRPPQFELIDDQAAFEDVKLEFTVSASDPDGDGLTYSIADKPDGGEFNPESGTFFWFPVFSDEGSHVVQFIVTDDGEGQLQDIMNVTITVDVNHPPVFEDIGTVSGKEAELIEFTAAVTDSDGDNVTVKMDEWPGDAVFDPDTRIFSWTPGYEDAGEYTAVFIAEDDGSPQKSAAMNVTILVENNNRAPELVPIGPKSVDPGNEETLTFSVTATDPDFDNLIYTTSALPGDSTFINQVFNWFPGSADTGIHTVRFIVTDDDNDNPLSTFEDVQIEVSYSTAPFVVSETPFFSETDVSINTQIIAQFSKPMDLTPVGGNPFTVIDAELQQTVAGTVTYQSDSFSAVFTPLSPLDPGRVYGVTVSQNVTDLTGTPMGNAVNWSFTTLP